MNQNNESLLSENKVKPKSVFSTKLVISLAGTLVFFGVVFLYYISTIQTPSLLDEDAERQEKATQEALNRGEKLVEHYKTEGIPKTNLQLKNGNFGLEKVDSSLPKGKYVFSAKQKPFLNGIQIFSLDVASSTAQPVPYLDAQAPMFMAEFESIQNPKNFFTLAQANKDEEPDGLSIQTYDTTSSKFVKYNNTKGIAERNFAWSEAVQFFAFNRLRVEYNSYLDFVPLENWEIAIVDTKSDALVESISGAYKPGWSPSGKILVYLRPDGLYFYNRDSKEERKVIEIENNQKVNSTSMIDVSPDGKYLAWTTPKSGIISIYSIVSWEAFDIKEIGRIQTEGVEYYWPQFSPDGKHYAVQAIDSLKEGDYVRSNARIEIRPTESREIVYTYSLNQFAFEVMFTDAWVK